MWGGTPLRGEEEWATLVPLRVEEKWATLAVLTSPEKCYMA